MEDEDGNTRKEAAICCCRLVANSLSAKSASHFSSSRFNRIGGARRRRLVEEVCIRVCEFIIPYAGLLKLLFHYYI